jgi:hypothetical protein
METQFGNFNSNMGSPWLVFFGNVVSQHSRGEVSIILVDGDAESIKKQIFQPIFQEFVLVAAFDSTPQIQ